MLLIFKYKSDLPTKKRFANVSQSIVTKGNENKLNKKFQGTCATEISQESRKRAGAACAMQRRKTQNEPARF